MKKIIYFILFMLVCVFSFAQSDSSSTQGDVQGLTLTHIWEGVVTFWSYLNWVYIVAFILFSGIFNMYVSAENKAPGLNWFRKVPMALWVILIGAFLALIFVFVFDVNTKQSIAGLFFSLFISMGIYKLGIDKFIKWVAGKLGFQLKSCDPKP